MYYYKSSTGIQSTLFIYIHKNLKLIFESILLTVNFNFAIFCFFPYGFFVDFMNKILNLWKNNAGRRLFVFFSRIKRCQQQMVINYAILACNKMFVTSSNRWLSHSKRIEKKNRGKMDVHNVPSRHPWDSWFYVVFFYD